LSITPSAKFIYIVKSTFDQLAGFIIDVTGALLSQVPNSPVPTRALPQDVTIDPSNRFLYVLNQESTSGANGTLSLYQIDPVTGNLPFVIALAGTAGIRAVAVTGDPTGQFLYVANSGATSNSVSGFIINSGAGTLTQTGAGPTSAGNTPQAVGVDESGRFLYVANGNSANISGFRIKTGGGQDGQLDLLPGQPFPAGLTPTNVAPHPSGKWIFVTNSGDGTLSVYRIDASTGAITLASAPTVVGITPVAVTTDPSGAFVYVTTWGAATPPPGPGVVVFPFDAGTGLLGPPVAGSPFPVGAQPAAIKTTGTIQ
jgi:6-phosphogluconolactonase